MGAVLQTAGVAELAAELTCCACSSICGFAARDSSTRAKFRYCSFLLLATVTCVIALIPGLRAKMDKIPNLCTKVVSPDTCDKFVGFGAVYRIIFAMTAFHFILALLTVRVKRVTGFRARFNNGLWMFKMGLIFALTFATFYIPKKTGFFRVWMYLSLLGGFMFVMFQIILVIDFGHSWSLTWAERLETGHMTKLWYIAMSVFTLLIFAVSFGALIAFYIYFTHPANIMKCNANFFYISFMGIQCVLAVAVSVSPSVQQHLSGAGLSQSSVVVLYALYLTWNTLSSEPDSSCNPLGNVILEYDSFTGVSGGAIFGCLLTLVLLVFACTVRTNTSHLGKYGLALAESDTFAMATLYEDKKLKTKDDKIESDVCTKDYEVSLADYVGYNYSFFHIIMSLASMHILMVLTNWHSPEEHSNMKTLVKNWPSVWVQMASSFACILIYIWFLVTPLVKRVWGPTFGANFNETVMYEKSIRGNLLAFKNKAPAKYTTQQPIIDKKPVARDKEQPIEEKLQTFRNAKRNSFVSQQPTQDDSKLYFEFSNFKNSQIHDDRQFKSPTLLDKIIPSRQHHVSTKDKGAGIARQQVEAKLKMMENSLTVTDTRHLENEFLSRRRSSKGFSLHKEPSVRTDTNRNKMVDGLSTVSTSTRKSNFYNYKNRRRMRSTRLSHRVYKGGGDTTSNTSIESINSWVSTGYREKYQPLKHLNRRDDSDIFLEEEERDSPIDNSSQDRASTLKQQSKLMRARSCSVNNNNTNIRSFPAMKHRNHLHSGSSSITNNTFQTGNRSTHLTHPHQLATNQMMIKIQKSSQLGRKQSTDERSTIYDQPATAATMHDNDIDNDASEDSRTFKRRRKRFTKNFIRRTRLNRETGRRLSIPPTKHLVEKQPADENFQFFPTVYATNINDKKNANRFPSQSERSVAETYQSALEMSFPRTMQASASRNSATTKPHRSKPPRNDVGGSFTSTHKERHRQQNRRMSISDEIHGQIYVNKNSREFTREDLAESRLVDESRLDHRDHHKTNRTQDISIVPSVFKRKPQTTETASELLRLQWKILRTQAKIVNIQERIYKLQEHSSSGDGERG